MDSHPGHSNQPSGQAPMNQSLGNHLDDQQQPNLPAVWTCLELHRQQVDRILRIQNEQVCAALHQEVSLQNEELLAAVDSVLSAMLMQNNEEVSHLRMELQNTQEALQSTLQNRDGWMYLAMQTYQENEALISQLSSIPQVNLHGPPNELESTGSCNQAMNMEATVERTHPSLVCKLCSSDGACIIVLPCLHLCACKSCESHLTMCPICNSAKVDVIEARFG